MKSLEDLYTEEIALERASVISFGKYKGKTVQDVIEMNPGYLIWANENVSFFALSSPLLNEVENLKSIRDRERNSGFQATEEMLSGYDPYEHFD